MTNDLASIERHAKALMNKHGVGYVQFKFDRARSRLGSCQYTWATGQDGRRIIIPSVITFSRAYAEILPLPEIEQTILHEIAHALTPGDKHGRRWQAKAKEIGHTGSRCAEPSVIPEPAVVGTCPCGQVIAKQQRLPLRVYWHRQSNCPLPGKNLVIWTRKGQPVPDHAMPERFRKELTALRSRGII